MTRWLVVTLATSGETVLHLTWKGGAVISRHVDDRLKDVVDQWLEHGVVDWEGSEEDPPTTPPRDPEFLFRLGEYIRRQSVMQVTFGEE